MSTQYLNELFAPRSVAVFGASEENTVGGRVFRNLAEAGFEGAIYPVNPKYKKVFGHTCYASVADIGKRIDLAAIATPARTVSGIVRQCGEAGVHAAIVLSAGFGEGDGRGAHLQRALVAEARRQQMRILGPNCLGLINPHINFNATFSKCGAKPGSLALVSQSGALCTAILDWAAERQVGFSAVVSMGDAADVGFGEVLDHLALDQNTTGILLYVEGIRHPRRFLSGLRAAARIKPVIVVKAGRQPQGAKAAISHTAALVGGDDAFEAALRRAGVVRAMSIEQLFAAAQLLSTHHRVRGNRLAIVTNAGALGVLATDRASELNLRIADLTDETLGKLDETLSEAWPRSNPIDILGDAPPRHYHGAVSACVDDPGVDGVLVMLTPQAMTEPHAAAQAVIEAAQDCKKPVLTCWMGGPQVQSAKDLFDQSRVPTFPSPENAVEAFAYLASYHRNQRLLLEVPGPLADRSKPDSEGARLILEGALREGRTVLSTTESKALLTAFRIPVMQAVPAMSANDALVAAESLGFPVAMKIHSHDITHKSDIGGVRLNIASASEVRSAYQDMVDRAQAKLPDARITGVTVERMCVMPNARELLVGVARDEALGPVVSFGAGGTAVEVLEDRAVALPPLNRFIAKDLIRRTRIARSLVAFRSLPPVNLPALEQVLLRVSEMVCELPEIRELDINPLFADEKGTIAVDARVVLDPAPQPLGRYAHMAIHPYPSSLETHSQLADGTDICIRPIRPEDAEIEQTMIRALSPESKYFRFMSAITELTPEMLIRFTQIDYDREMAFIATAHPAGVETQIGVVRYVAYPDGKSCEFALVVADDWHRRGIGSMLMKSLMSVARDRGLTDMYGDILGDNAGMLRLVGSLGFSVTTSSEDPAVQVAHRSLRGAY